MSIESMAIALHHSRTNGAAKLVLVGIANHDGDGGAWPSVSTLAKYAGVSARNVQKHISTLVELGEVQRHMQQGGTRMTPDHSRPNLYTFTLRCPPGCDRTKNHRVVDNFPQGVSPATGGVGRDTRGVSPATGEGVSPATPEPYLEPPSNSDGSFLSTSPERAAVCWACGQPQCTNGKKYCTSCENTGRNNPFIECTGCGVARRRHTPGQQNFTCDSCKSASPSNEAFDDEGANHHDV